MDYQKQAMHWLSALLILAALGIAVYMLAAEAFTAPLSILAVVLALAALWFQQEGK